MPMHGLWECRVHSKMHVILNEGYLHGVIGWGLNKVLRPHNCYLIIRAHLLIGGPPHWLAVTKIHGCS